jgi:hypothetical protein
MAKNPDYRPQWLAIRRLRKHNEEFTHFRGLRIAKIVRSSGRNDMILTQ